MVIRAFFVPLSADKSPNTGIRLRSFPSKLGRRHSCELPKGAGKVILILKAAGLGNFGNGLIRKFKQFLCPIDADLQHEFHGWHFMWNYPRNNL